MFDYSVYKPYRKMDTNIYDVCVIGAGLYGSAAAYHLSLNPNIKVCLVGPNHVPPNPSEHSIRSISSSHYDEARIVRQCATNILDGEIAKRSFEGFRQLEKQTGIPFIRECGIVYYRPVGSKSVATCKHVAEKLGFQPLSMNRDQLMQQFPYLDIGKHNECIFQLSNCGMVNPKKLILAMKSVAGLQGCDIFNNIAERVFKNYSPGKGQILHVKLEDGQLVQAKKVLLCTGAFTHFKHLLPSSRQLNLKVKPLQTLRIEMSSEDVHRFYHMPAMTSLAAERNDSDCYICAPVAYPDGKTYLKIGHGGTERLETQEEVIKWYQSDGNPQMTERLKRIIQTLFSGLDSLSTTVDTCVECQTQDGFPYIDMVSPNMGVAVGGNGVGARGCYEIGKMAASMIAKGHWHHDLPEDRFKACFKSKSSKL